MKHLLIAGLLAAIGAVALVGPAHAGSKYCYYNPDDPDCYNQGGYDDGSDEPFPPPPPPRRHSYDDSGYGQNDYGDDNGFYEPPPPRRPVYQAASRCEAIGQSLRERGYRHVRATVCNRKNYNKYEAFRGHTRFLIKVKASSGKIIYEVPG
jgi:hypothetical protein